MVVVGTCVPRLLPAAVLFLLRPSAVAARNGSNETEEQSIFHLDLSDITMTEEEEGDSTGLIVGVCVGIGVVLLLLACWWWRQGSNRLSLRRPGPRMTGGFVHGASKNSPLDQVRRRTRDRGDRPHPILLRPTPACPSERTALTL